MMKHPVFTFTTMILLAAGCPRFVSAAIVTLPLGGNTSSAGWNDLTITAIPGFGGFPGTTDWPRAIASQTGDGTGQLTKVANGAGGGPYPAGQGFYYGGFSPAHNFDGGTLAVTAAAIGDVKTATFQITIGEAWKYDFKDGVLPTLSYNSGSQSLTATYSVLTDKVFNGLIEMPSGMEEIYINTYALQWDLSAIVEPITELSVQWTAVQHAQIPTTLPTGPNGQFVPGQTALQLDQSSEAYAFSVLPPVVPEPTAVLLLAASAVAGLTQRRRGL